MTISNTRRWRQYCNFPHLEHVHQYSLGKMVPEYQTILDFAAATDSAGMAVVTTSANPNKITTININTQFLQAVCPFCRPNNNVKAVKATD